ncbi:choline ABC transporter substrate-binding protein [Pseudomonas sp. RIT-PI-S]|uniref:choline ABC transporter substrate-binding protein n=1 Tax=Pseudomonas sp. RIT-PI-S TaxID=3035295 RepID=UPI0021D8FF49|nr:choline ABC transporter substrate-binding protein [Pseudomonas sp. RIT-PI-S]
MKTLSTALLFAGLGAVSLAAQAADNCSPVKLADPGWSDIAATNALAGIVLEGMGYKTKVDALAVPITYGGLRDGQIDVFLGNWMPAQKGFDEQFVASGKVTRLAENLQGTEFTLAVPDYVYDAGVHDFKDLNAFADKFDHKIFGIGSGAPANQSIQEMIKKNDFNLGQWKLVESSEQAMLAEVDRAVKHQRFVTFLGWTPHPMNVKLKMHYLTGGEAYFGASGSVYTLTRNGYAQACPEVAKLFTQMTFSQEMENAIMAEVVDKKISNADAAKAWLKAHPQTLEKWLGGLKTLDGKDALPAVQATL